MKVLSHLNDAIFATVTVKLKEELWSLSRGNTAAESAGNAWESKVSKLMQLDIVHQGIPMMSL